MAQEPQRISVLGLGDPVLDIVCDCSHEFLASVTSEPGGCVSVSPEEMAELMRRAQAEHTMLRIPGGSAANVMKGMANISQGAFAAKFLGMIGRDETGSDYRSRLTGQGVTSLLQEATSSSPSAISLCLVTPDGQRTMRTCLGASLELQSISQLPPSALAAFSGLRLLHCEGYCLYRPKLAREICDHARSCGALVSIDLASFELVRNCKAALLDLLTAGCFDLVFANEEEAAALAVELSLTPASTAHDDKVAACQQYLLKHCRVSVVSLGPRGCVAKAGNGESGSSAAAGVKVVDTIGAGDTFASGFLTAYLQGGSLQQAAEAGCTAGSEAVTVRGADLSEANWQRVGTKVQAILARGAKEGAKGANGVGPVHLCVFASEQVQKLTAHWSWVCLSLGTVCLLALGKSLGFGGKKSASRG